MILLFKFSVFWTYKFEFLWTFSERYNIIVEQPSLFIDSLPVHISARYWFVVLYPRYDQIVLSPLIEVMFFTNHYCRM
jgi:hypothetical protein